MAEDSSSSSSTSLGGSATACTADNSTEFWRLFNEKCGQCRQFVEEITAENASELSAQVKELLAELQTFATDSTRILPQYDIKRTQEEIELLKLLLSKSMTTAKPRKKFKFTSLHQGTTKARTAKAQSNTKDNSAPSSSASTIKAASGSLLIENVVNDDTIVSTEMLSQISPDNRCQILVRKCKGVNLVSLSLIGSIRMEDLEDCYVILGSCGTSVYLEGCKNVVLFVTCHQMRIHKCTDCKIHVHCKSHPIIEDCMGMKFAPYGFTYDCHDSNLSVSPRQCHWRVRRI
jgi:hypothetical protein